MSSGVFHKRTFCQTNSDCCIWEIPVYVFLFCLFEVGGAHLENATLESDSWLHWVDGLVIHAVLPKVVGLGLKI